MHMDRGRHKHVMMKWGAERICKVCRMTDYEIAERAAEARKRAAKATADRQARVKRMRELGLWPGLPAFTKPDMDKANGESIENNLDKSLDNEFPF